MPAEGPNPVETSHASRYTAVPVGRHRDPTQSRRARHGDARRCQRHLYGSRSLRLGPASRVPPDSGTHERSRKHASHSRLPQPRWLHVARRLCVPGSPQVCSCRAHGAIWKSPSLPPTCPKETVSTRYGIIRCGRACMVERYLIHTLPMRARALHLSHTAQPIRSIVRYSLHGTFPIGGNAPSHGETRAGGYEGVVTPERAK